MGAYNVLARMDQICSVSVFHRFVTPSTQRVASESTRRSLAPATSQFPSSPRRPLMPYAQTARGWLESPAPPPTLPAQRSADCDAADPSKNGAVACTREALGSTKPRREWARPIPVSEQNTCCVRVRCVDKFAEDADSFLARTLAQEQEMIRKYKTREDRKNFVLERVPVVELGRRGGSMIAAGVPVCTTFFKASFGVSNHVIDACKGTPNARASSGPGWGSEGEDAAPKRDFALSWVDYWVDLYGQFMPDKSTVVICSATKEELYEEFIKEAVRVYPNDPSKRVSKAHFLRILRKNRPHIRVRVGGDFMKCDTCVELKEKRYGTPGVKPTLDSIARRTIDEDLSAHRKMVASDRLVIARSTDSAMRAKADGKPLEFVFMSIDAANQTSHALPDLYPPTHGSDRGYSERQKIMAAHIEGQFAEVYFTPQNLGGGCNLAYTAAHLALTRIIDKYDGGTPPAKNYIIHHTHWQVDNCVSENKNNFFVGYAGLLVAANVIRVVEIHFMPVGHTHTKIDQVFSRFACGIKGKNIFTRTQLAEELRASYTEAPVFCQTLRNQGNFKGLLAGRVNRIPHITTFRAFRIEKRGDGRVKVSVKPHMHSTKWSGIYGSGDTHPDAPPHDLFIGHPPRIQDAPPYQLKRVPDEVILKVKQRYLASHERLAAAYPLDGDAIERAKNEQSESVRLLGMTGEREFDLPVHWLPDDDGGDDDFVEPEAGVGNDGETGGDSGTDSEDGNGDCQTEDSTSESDLDTHYSRQAGHCASGRSFDDRKLVSVQAGNFAFFLAREAPFLVGKIVAERVDDNGERGVDLHWFRPANNHTRDRAATTPFAQYGKSTFVEGYVLQGGGGARGAAKTKRVKDVSWEPLGGIVVTCDKLIANGKRIPSRVLTALGSVAGDRHRAGSFHGEGRRLEQKERERAKSDENTIIADIGEKGEQCGTGVPKRPRVPLQPLQQNTRVRLTAAHFRPRRDGRGSG